MSCFQQIVWPEDEADGVRLSRIRARDLAHKRKQRKRQERFYPVLWGAAIFCWIYLCLWVAFG